MNPASAGSPKGRDAVGGSIREADDIAVGEADDPNSVGMTQDTPSIAAIVEGLSEAQKRTLLCLPANGNPRYCFERGEIGGLAPLARKGLAEKMWSPSRDCPWRLTPLGLAVRTALQEQSK